MKYRGATWTAISIAPASPASTGAHRVAELVGSRLLVDPPAPLCTSSFPIERLPMEIAIVLLVIAVIFIARSVKVVPQQNAWVKERLGKYAGTLTPGLNILVPSSTAWPTSTA